MHDERKLPFGECVIPKSRATLPLNDGEVRLGLETDGRCDFSDDESPRG